MAKVSADMAACNFPARGVCWHQKACSNSLVASREAYPWFSCGLGNVRCTVELDDLKGLFLSEQFCDSPVITGSNMQKGGIS